MNAAYMKNVPVRKTDIADAAWIDQLLERGLLRPSLVFSPWCSPASQPDPLSTSPGQRALPDNSASGEGTAR
ncbi:MAG: hypothetical protein ACLQVK_25745, partial [Acidimicrobiales bacterium]